LTAVAIRFFASPLVAHIGPHKNGFAPVAFDRLDCLQPGGIDIADHNLCAALSKELRGRATNPSTPARDKRDFTGEAE
jgi:hypothetical protein